MIKIRGGGVKGGDLHGLAACMEGCCKTEGENRPANDGLARGVWLHMDIGAE